MRHHGTRAVLTILALGFWIGCAQRTRPETSPGEPAEASQERPPGVPAAVQPAEPGLPDQDVPPSRDVPPEQDLPPDRDSPPAEPAEVVPVAAEEPSRQEVPAAQTTAEPERARDDEAGSNEEPEVRELLLLGPTYTPHDRAPRVVWDTEAQALVSRKLLPVLQSQRLPARTRALFWVLLRPDGSIADVVPQTLTENARFDAAAAEIVRQLRFTPAIRNGRAVAVWVIQEISLLMQ